MRVEIKNNVGYAPIETFAIPYLFYEAPGANSVVFKHDNSFFAVKVVNEVINDSFWCVYEVKKPETHIKLELDKAFSSCPMVVLKMLWVLFMI